MADIMNIQKLVKAAAAKELAKQAASVDSERNNEHEEDMKGIPANVDSQSGSEAVGVAEKDPAMNIGTKAEATTDKPAEDSKKDKDDDDAFKSASDLQKLAKKIISSIETAVEKEAKTKKAETAITVDAAEGTCGKNSEDDQGKEESIEGGEADGEATQTTDSATQTSAPKQEEAGSASPEEDPNPNPPKEKKASYGELATEIYKMAQEILTNSNDEITKSASMDEELTEEDIEGLEDDEADELAAALQASAMDAANEGTEDADNVAQYLDAYQNVPEGLGEDFADVPDQSNGVDGDIEQFLAMLQEAGVSPEELAGMAQKEASVKEDDAWKSLSKEAKHKVVLDVLEGFQSK